LDADGVAALFKGAVKAKEILQLETMVLGGLQFDLVVYHPYKYVDAMVEVQHAPLSDTAT
jgi:hypothetical protein